MAERILGTIPKQNEIRHQLALYRQTPERFIKQSYPQLSFVTLRMLAHEPLYTSLLHQPLLRQAMEDLPHFFTRLPGSCVLDPARVWVSIAAASDTDWFGGFHHADQGYRYLQQIALTSLSGTLAPWSIDKTLRTLELLRAYVHDSLHHSTYRLFCPIPAGSTSSETRSFYRLQYGINFRRPNGQSYSAKDPVRSLSTLNLGNIMEAATDRFAQEFILKLAEQQAFQLETGTLIEQYLYRESTGQLTEQDLLVFRSIERGQAEYNLPLAFKGYLRPMRLFNQYVTMRYRAFLVEHGESRQDELHTTLLQAMISGKSGQLQRLLNELQGETRSFVALFKTQEY